MLLIHKLSCWPVSNLEPLDYNLIIFTDFDHHTLKYTVRVEYHSYLVVVQFSIYEVIHL